MGTYHYTSGADRKSLPNGTGLGAENYSNKAANSLKPGNENTDEEDGQPNDGRHFDDKTAAVIPYWTKEKALLMRSFYLSG